MASQACCIVREADCGVMLGKTEEGVAEVIDIEDGHVVLDHVGDVQEDLGMFQHGGGLGRARTGQRVNEPRRNPASGNACSKKRSAERHRGAWRHHENGSGLLRGQ